MGVFRVQDADLPGLLTGGQGGFPSTGSHLLRAPGEPVTSHRLPALGADDS